MKIQSINNYQTNQSFSGIYRVVHNNKSGIVEHRNTSWMFRPSLKECKQFYNYLSRIFQGIDKVNVYNYGCSLGYEAYSFIIGMLSGKKKNPEKFMPIMAKDYDEDIINSAKKYALTLEDKEMFNIDSFFNFNENKRRHFIDFVSLGSLNCANRQYYADINAWGDNLGIPSDKIVDNVEFSVADIRTDYKNIEPQNSVIIATNLWPYMDIYDRHELVRNLYNHLDKNCYIKIDGFDNGKYPFEASTATGQLLMKNGFKPTPIENLYKK